MTRTTQLGTDCRIELVEVQSPLWSELSAGLEWLELRGSAVYRGQGIPHGSGQPVIAVPGFLSSDIEMLELRRWLGRIGYTAFASGTGLNADCPDVIIEKLIETAEDVAARSGQQVRLVGHSLGGVLSRAAAVLRPDLVS
jgi:pimeloyl-ACP methyl ester carboxylesterase